jgi:hypothetical protein
VPTYVPKVDADGNEIVGVKPLLARLPLGTYLGWNVTSTGWYKGKACAFSGGFIPFAKTKAERLASGDPRLSLEERYGTVWAITTRPPTTSTSSCRSASSRARPRSAS